jgi:hypothetical protein
MKHNLALLAIRIFVGLASWAQTAAGSAQADPLQTSLFDSTNTIFEAQKTKNVSALDGFLASDFREVGSEGMLHDRKEFLDDVGEGHLKEYSLYDAKLVPVDESAVILTYKGIFRQFEGDDVLAPRYQHFSDLWIKQGGQWKLKYRQSTPRRPID